MFYVKDPCTLGRPWTLSKKGAENPAIIPLEVTKFLKNYHIIGIEFLYHNYRKGIKGTILNQEPGMNYPLQISAFFRAVLNRPEIILVICPQHSSSFWHYHLVNHGNFTVIRINEKNSKTNFDDNKEKLALLLELADIKLCQDLESIEFFSIIIENLDQVANKMIIKRLDAKFNIGLTCRSFYTDPDQKLQWKMLNWANPGCVGKLNDFYEVDNRNFENFQDNYRFWWLRLTWHFCDSFARPQEEEVAVYERSVAEWARALDLPPEKKSRKRKHTEKSVKPLEPAEEPAAETASHEVPIEKYVKLPSMDESPILTSIIKNFEISPEPILRRAYDSLPYTLTRPTYSKYEEEDNVILSFIDSKERPSTSKSESEEFIINLIKKPENEESRDIEDILKEADAVLQN